MALKFVFTIKLYKRQLKKNIFQVGFKKLELKKSYIILVHVRPDSKLGSATVDFRKKKATF